MMGETATHELNPKQLVAMTHASNDFILIEGFHAVKHALRFKAELLGIFTCNVNLERLSEKHSPDITGELLQRAQTVDEATFATLSPRKIRTQILAVARHPGDITLESLPNQPIIVLDNPRDVANVGAVIRVAAATSASAVIVLSDELDPWHPSAIRGAAGLQFSLPCQRIALNDTSAILTLERDTIAYDERGSEIPPNISSPQGAVYIFGSERSGIRSELRDQADQIVRLPMRDKVSSLNLATSVAGAMYWSR